MDYDRPTEELKLAESGAVVTLYANVTTGDYRKIQRSVMEGMRVKFNKDDPENPDIQDVSGGVTMDQEETVLSCLLVKVVDKEGNEVKNTKEFVYNLPIPDGTALYDRLNELSAKSSLSGEAKKK